LFISCIVAGKQERKKKNHNYVYFSQLINLIIKYISKFNKINDEKGKYNLTFFDPYLKSPGSFPIQPNLSAKIFKNNPTTTEIKPKRMSHLLKSFKSIFLK
tara:strand:+ start:291 stop:593 length:303 start_codon:yes stop_codon:yes gene_type:complete